MDLTFNEISLNDYPASEHEAKEILKNFAKVCSELKQQGFKKLRTEINFWVQRYYEEMDINSFLHKIGRTQSSFLRSFIRRPYIADEFISKADEYFADFDYYFNGNKVAGLAYAYLLNTIAVSLSTSEVWNTHEIEILEKRSETESRIAVRNVATIDHIEQHREWIESNKPVVLVKTSLRPEDKSIKLRDDHGKDILQQFANRLINCDYVVEIINSIPFNPHERNFIHKVYPNGQIEIVLSQTDQGLGLLIQTTGRNQRETEKIAGIIQERYG